MSRSLVALCLLGSLFGCGDDQADSSGDAPNLGEAGTGGRDSATGGRNGATGGDASGGRTTPPEPVDNPLTDPESGPPAYNRAPLVRTSVYDRSTHRRQNRRTALVGNVHIGRNETGYTTHT